MSLRSKLKVKTDLAKQIEKEEESDSGNRDKRFLNYYDLKYGEKMTVLFVPDVNGQAWTTYRRHSAPRGIRGLDAVGCPGASSCAICQKGFDAYEVFKETNDKDDKEYAKKFFARDVAIASVVVIDSPCDINVDENENDVKLFNMPFAIEKILKEAIKEEQIDDDSLVCTPFVIKKTKNQGGQAAYDSSYFQREQLDDDAFEVMENEMNIDLFDYEELDIIPSIPEEDEAEAWAAKLEQKLAAKAESGDDNKKKSVKDRLNKNKKKDDEDTDTTSEEKETDSQDGASDDGESSGGSKASSLRNRLRATSKRD